MPLSSARRESGAVSLHRAQPEASDLRENVKFRAPEAPFANWVRAEPGPNWARHHAAQLTPSAAGGKRSPRERQASITRSYVRELGAGSACHHILRLALLEGADVVLHNLH